MEETAESLDEIIISAAPVINRGNEDLHTYTGFFGRIQIEASYKRWTLSTSAYPSMFL